MSPSESETGVGVGVFVGVGVCVGMGVAVGGIGVEVGVLVFVGAGVSVGPSNWPGLHPVNAAITLRTNIAGRAIVSRANGQPFLRLTENPERVLNVPSLVRVL